MTEVLEGERKMRNFINIILTIVTLFLVISCSNNKVNDILNGSFIEPPEKMNIPTLLKPNYNEIITSDCVFIWTKVENATSYRIEICGNEQFKELVFNKEVDIEQLQVSISELTLVSRKLFWRIIPLFSGINGSPSETFRINVILSGIIYVSNSFTSSSSSTNGFGYSDDPFKSIDDAVDIANKIDGIQKIYIAEGTYTTESVISQDVEIYGGFSKADWNLRDKDIYKTIIIPRSYTQFTFLSPITRSTIIDGIYFDNYYVGYCTCIYISASASPVISNNVFKNTFQEATQISIYSLNYSNPLIQNCNLEMQSSNNSIPNVSTLDSNVEIINSTFNGAVQLMTIDANVYNSTFNGGMTIQGSSSIVHNNNFMNTLFINGSYSEVYNNSMYIYCWILLNQGNIASNYLEGSTSLSCGYAKFEKNSIIGALRLWGGGSTDILNNYFSNKITQTYSDNIYVYIRSSSNSTEGNILIENNYFEIPILTGSDASAIRINTYDNNSTSSIFSIYFVNNTIKYRNSLSYTNYGIYYINNKPINAYFLNNIFVTTGSSDFNIGIWVNNAMYPTMRYNSFVGTSLVNHALNLSWTSYSSDGLNILTGSVTNTYDFNYNNVFVNIEATSAPYILKSTATCAIDKGYNYSILGTNISDFLVTDITSSHSRLSGSAIDIGAYEYQ